MLIRSLLKSYERSNLSVSRDLGEGALFGKKAPKREDRAGADRFDVNDSSGARNVRLSQNESQ